MAVSNSDVAVKLNIKHRRGDTFIREFTFTKDGAPMDLTDWSARMQVREQVTSRSQSTLRPPVIAVTTEDHITIQGEDNNVLRVLIPATDMQIPAIKYLWDLELTSDIGVVTTFLTGEFELSQDITD